MNAQTWIIIAAIAVQAAAIVYLTVLVFGLQTQVRRMQRAPSPPAIERSVEAAVGVAFRDQVKKLLEHTLDTSAQAPPPPPRPPSPPSGEDASERWNPERRFRIVTMAERGEQPERIAAALRIPVSEVELFLRVHQIARV